MKGTWPDQGLLEQTLREYRIEGVVHFAGYAYVGESMREPSKYFTNNVVNTLNLLEAMRRTGIKHIVFSSSCATYGVPVRVPIGEDCPQQLVNPYGESKLFVERALRWYSQAYGTSWVALRYFNAAGADPEGEIGENHDPETHLIPLVIQAALGRSQGVEIYGTDYETPDGTAIRDYVHVTDLAEAHVQALGYLLDGNGPIALNLGTGLGHSVREVIRAVQRVEGIRVPTREGPRRAGDPPVLVADPSQARCVLGWQPVLSDLDTIVATAWQWYARRLCLTL